MRLAGLAVLMLALPAAAQGGAEAGHAVDLMPDLLGPTWVVAHWTWSQGCSAQLQLQLLHDQQPVASWILDVVSGPMQQNLTGLTAATNYTLVVGHVGSCGPGAEARTPFTTPAADYVRPEPTTASQSQTTPTTMVITDPSYGEWSNLVVKRVTRTTADLEWDFEYPCGNHVSGVSYQRAGQGTWTTVDAPGVGHVRYTLTGLEAGSTYQVRVGPIHFCGIGGDGTPPVTFTTQGRPGTHASLAPTEVAVLVAAAVGLAVVALGRRWG